MTPSSFTWYMDEMVWKSGLEGSRSTTRCALYIEMFFFTVVYLRIMVLQSVRRVVRNFNGRESSNARDHSPPEPVEPRLLLGVAALLLPVLLLEVGVEPVRPLADAADVQCEVARLLGRRGYRERVPFAEGEMSRDISHFLLSQTELLQYHDLCPKDQDQFFDLDLSSHSGVLCIHSTNLDLIFIRFLHLILILSIGKKITKNDLPLILFEVKINCLILILI